MHASTSKNLTLKRKAEEDKEKGEPNKKGGDNKSALTVVKGDLLAYPTDLLCQQCNCRSTYTPFILLPSLASAD
jgi:hypothetical protein